MGLPALLSHIITEGKFSTTGPDFSRIRKEALTGLEAFCPRGAADRSNRVRLTKHPRARFWMGQAAFLKSAWREKAAHLPLHTEKLSYVRIPKAANTSIAYALLKKKYPALAARTLTPQRIHALTDMNAEHALTEADHDNIFFTAVRDPLTRLVSVYRSFFEGADKTFLYEDYLFGALKRGMSFHEFLRILKNIPDALKDRHLKPQHRFLQPYARRGLDVKVFRLEEPAPLERFLAGYGLALPRLNVSPGPIDPAQYYSPATRALAEQIYRRDLDLFGY